jgi:hypothetical protein
MAKKDVIFRHFFPWKNSGKSKVKIYKNEKMNENFYFILIKNKIKMNYV